MESTAAHRPGTAPGVRRPGRRMNKGRVWLRRALATIVRPAAGSIGLSSNARRGHAPLFSTSSQWCAGAAVPRSESFRCRAAAPQRKVSVVNRHHDRLVEQATDQGHGVRGLQTRKPGRRDGGSR